MSKPALWLTVVLSALLGSLPRLNAANYFYLSSPIKHNLIPEYSQVNNNHRHLVGLVGDELVQPIHYQYMSPVTQATSTAATSTATHSTTTPKPSQKSYLNWNALAPSGGVHYYSKSSHFSSPSNVTPVQSFSRPSPPPSHLSSSPAPSYRPSTFTTEMPTYHDESPTLIGEHSEIGYQQQPPPSPYVAASGSKHSFPHSNRVQLPAFGPVSYQSNGPIYSGSGAGYLDANGFRMPIQAAVISSHHLHYYDVPSTGARQPTPTTIEVGASSVPLNILLRSRSTSLNIEQIHESAGGSYSKTESEDLPHTLRHTVIKPIVQELYELIKPYRIIRQEMKPVQEVIETIVARDLQHKDHLHNNRPAENDQRSGNFVGIGQQHVHQLPLNLPRKQLLEPVIQQQHELHEQHQLIGNQFEPALLPPGVQSRQLLEQIGSDYIAASSNSLFTGLYGSPALASVSSSLSSPYYYYPSQDQNQDMEYSDNTDDDNEDSEESTQTEETHRESRERERDGDDEYGGKIAIHNDNFGKRIHKLQIQKQIDNKPQLEPEPEQDEYEDNVNEDDSEVEGPELHAPTKLTKLFKVSNQSQQLSGKKSLNELTTVGTNITPTTSRFYTTVGGSRVTRGTETKSSFGASETAAAPVSVPTTTTIVRHYPLSTARLSKTVTSPKPKIFANKKVTFTANNNRFKG